MLPQLRSRVELDQRTSTEDHIPGCESNTARKEPRGHRESATDANVENRVRRNVDVLIVRGKIERLTETARREGDAGADHTILLADNFSGVALASVAGAQSTRRRSGRAGRDDDEIRPTARRRNEAREGNWLR